jgi:quinol-cytochrome oxidoreductase complex cytochrome b subunit
MTATIEIVAVLITGCMVGVEFAVVAFAHPVFAGLPDDAFRAARSEGSRLLGRVMPFWYVGTLVALIAAAVVTHSGLAGIAIGLMAAVVLLTLAVLVPINNRIAAWSATGELSRELAGRWDRLHWLRVAILAAIFVLLTAACFGR